jgi:hypothetical protein
MHDAHIDFAAEAPPGYVTQPDVAYWAEKAMFDHLRSMPMDEKLEHIKSFWRAAHSLHIAGLAHRFPDASPEELELRAAEIRLGKETVAALLEAGIRPPWERGAPT